MKGGKLNASQRTRAMPSEAVVVEIYKKIVRKRKFLLKPSQKVYVTVFPS